MTRLAHKHRQAIDLYPSTDSKFSGDDTACYQTVYGTKNQATAAVNGSKMLRNAKFCCHLPNDFDGFTACTRWNPLPNLAPRVRNGKGQERITSNSYAGYEGLSDPLTRGNAYAPVDWSIL